MKIWLDGGHGGKDSGALGFGLKEKDLTLTLVKKIGKLLEQYKDVEIRYSRVNDTFLELSERAKKANDAGADFFCSVHINATPTGSGFESYIYNEASEKSVAYQNVIHAEIMKQLGNVKDRGKRRANFAVIRETHMPALLTENLFIDNANDNKLLKQDEYLDRIALGHVNGFVKAFGLKKKESIPVVIPPSEKVVYRVISGSFSTYERAEQYVKTLEGKGIKSFIDTLKK